jgi:UDP-N-acetylmuramoyl-tripeptide--D-alanyl-D-alanine ligase
MREMRRRTTLCRAPLTYVVHFVRIVYEFVVSTSSYALKHHGLAVASIVALVAALIGAHPHFLFYGAGAADAAFDLAAAGVPPRARPLNVSLAALLERLQAAALKLQPSAKVFTFGGAVGKASATPVSYDTDGLKSRIVVDVMGERVSVSLDAVGEHWAGNASLALLAAVLAGVEAKAAAEALSGYAPPAGRGTAETLKLPKGGEATLVDDAYNANPESMRAAIEGFAARPGRKIVALGEMRELGPTSAELHAGLADQVILANVAAAVLSGGEMSHLAAALRARAPQMRVEHVTSPAEAADQVKSWLQPGDAVLIKGSNASGMAKVGTALRQMSTSVTYPQKASGA